ncbi:MAG: HutD family protein [Synergistaceae bacterium]|nr:HutD family protein [Synergistaceae bacterium]
MHWLREHPERRDIRRGSKKRGEGRLRLEIKKNSDHTACVWSGGRTTELFIYPETAKLEERNFYFRVSTATVEQEESIFSRFPGYVRHITPLAGGMKLIHGGRYAATLRPASVDIFDGSWATRSFGKCTDFNLIHRPEWMGRIGTLAHSGELRCPQSGFTIVYARHGAILEIKKGDEKFTEELGDGDLLAVETGQGESCLIRLSAGKIAAGPPVFATAARPAI